MARGKVHMHLYKDKFAHSVAFVLLEKQIISGKMYIPQKEIYSELGCTKQTFYNHLQNIRNIILLETMGITGARIGKQRYFTIDIQKYGSYLAKLKGSLTTN